MPYRVERESFKHLKQNVDGATLDEYAVAIKTVLERYNTTIYENRFVAGGAVEVFTCALLRSVGLDCKMYADQETAGDLLLPGGRKISVKGLFVGGPANVKLINQLGGRGRDREWETATLFIVSEVGIVYGDPDMINKEVHVKQVSDGLQLNKSAIEFLASKDRNLISLEIARKPSTRETGFSQKASTAVAQQVMADMELGHLMEAYSREN